MVLLLQAMINIYRKYEEESEKTLLSLPWEEQLEPDCDAFL
jgi:hypothetical protein